MQDKNKTIDALINYDYELIENSNILKQLKEAETLPPLTKIFGELMFQNEIHILAGDTGTGKSIFAYQFAAAMSKGEDCIELENEEHKPLRALYIDLELSLRGLKRRYPNQDAFFGENFFRLTAEDFTTESAEDSFSIYSLEEKIIKTGAELLIIDNLSAISMRSNVEQDESLKTMKELKRLVTEYQQLSILVLTHFPKVEIGKPININYISGSKVLTNFADSVSALGVSGVDIDKRYIKMLKSRNGEMSGNVILLDLIRNENDNLSFRFDKMDLEKNHLVKDKSQVDKYKVLAIEFFEDEIRAGEFIRSYSEKYNLTESNGKRILSILYNMNYIIKTPSGAYLLNGNIFADGND
jgi:predicted ATPase